MALDQNINKIKFLRSKTANAKPAANLLDEGELAINLTDRTIFSKSGNTVVDLGFGKGGNVDGGINATGRVSSDHSFNVAGEDTRVTMGNITDQGPYLEMIKDGKYVMTIRGYEKSGIQMSLTEGNLFVSKDVVASNFIGNMKGNADTASKLETPRAIKLGLHATGMVMFDGSKDEVLNVNVRPATTGQTGIVQLVDNNTSASTNQALTANQGRIVADVLRNSGLYQLADNNHISVAGPIKNTKDIAYNGFYRVAHDSTGSIDTWPNQTSGDALINAQWAKGFGYQMGSAKTTNSIYFRCVDNGNYKNWLKVIDETDVVDNLNTAVANRPLSANQGANLNNKKIENGKATEDYLSAAVDSYQTTNGKPYVNISDLPIGKTALFGRASIGDAPYLPEDGHVHVETHRDFTSSSQASFQVLTGYQTGKRGYRAKTNAGYSPWLITVASTEQISSAVDFDSLTQANIYSICTQHGTNRPTTAWGTLTVEGPVNIDSNARLTQTYTDDNANSLNQWVRKGKGTSGGTVVWTEWLVVADRNNSVASADKLTRARNIGVTGAGSSGSVAFDGSKNVNIPLTFATQATTSNDGNVATTRFVQAVNTAETGAAAYALKLKTPRKINNVDFDGTKDIEVYVVSNNIARDTDLDTMQTPGQYYSPSNASAATMKNTPGGSFAFNMRIDDMSSAGVTQTLTYFKASSAYGDTKWTRSIYNGVWSPWRKWASTDDNVASATKLETAREIKINGSRLTGAIMFDGTSNMTIPIQATTQAVNNNSTMVATTAFVQNVNKADTGSAATALTLKTARTIAISGSGASGSIPFDGSGNVTIPLSVGTQPTNTNNGSIATTAFVQAVNVADTGSAATALKLKTARRINGTNFDGGGNITTANWGTARNLTIGNKTQSVNGSANIAWTLADMGAVSKAGDTIGGNLNVTGAITATGDITAFSDRRLKDNIKKIDNALDKVDKLNGVTFTRNDLNDDRRYIGLIAQDVLEVAPEAISKQDEYYSVNYQGLVGLLVEAVKELKQEIKELKNGPTNER